MVLSFALLLILLPESSAQESKADDTRVKKVLMLFSEARDLPGNVMLEQAVRAEMAKGGTNRIEFYVESLDAGRFPDAGHYRLFKEYLERKYARQQLDLVMAFMARDFGLAGELPPNVVSNVPAVFFAINEFEMPGNLAGPRFTGIVQRFDVQGTMNFIFQLQPGTRHVVVIAGDSKADRLTLARVMDAARAVDGVVFEYWTNRPMAEIGAEVGSLSDDTVVLLSTVQKDVTGKQFYTSKMVQTLSPRASVPIYVLGAGSVGNGALGGQVVDFDDLGGTIGELGVKVLSGTMPNQIPVEVRTNGTPMVDWRELKRWHISESRLPTGSVVRFRPPSIWAEHKKFIIAAAAILLAQAVTIAALLLQRRLRRKAELRARENQAARALLAAIVESSEDAIIRKDLTGKIVTWNSSAERLFGYSANEAIGKSISLIVPPTMVREEEQILDRVKRGEPIQFYETVRMREDGTSVDVSLAISPIRDEQGNIIGTSKICRDITARKRAEAEIQRQHTELAHVTRVSTMGQLSSALAHELNQPLGAILRNAEAAEIYLQNENPDLGEIRAILADIRKDDQRAGTVIDRMRALLKRRSLESSQLDLRELLEDTVALARPDALARQVDLKLVLPKELPAVRGDRVHLQQVVLNLILNGMDAVNDCPQSERSLVVSATGLREGGVEVSVRDYGAGISPDLVEKIFEPFYTTKASGMGMGLAISRTIIEAHGGKIRAENNGERGATISFVIPSDRELV